MSSFLAALLILYRQFVARHLIQARYLVSALWNIYLLRLKKRFYTRLELQTKTSVAKGIIDPINL